MSSVTSSSVDSPEAEFSKCFKGAKVELRIDAEACLERRNGARRLPASLARSSAELDLLASTPVDAKEVHLLIPVSSEQAPRYFVVKKKLLDPVISALRDAGADVTAISTRQGETIVPVDARSLGALWPPSAFERLVARTGLFALAAFLASGVATYGYAYARYWQAGMDLDEKIAVAQIDAKAAKARLQKRQAQLADIAKVRAEKSETIPILSIWNELTGRLPDDVWLSDMEINGMAVSISGFARSSSGLVAAIDASPLFVTPAFAGAVVRAPGQESERFSLTARVSR